MFSPLLWADLSEFYSNYSSFSENSQFFDPNTGQSSFTSLLIPFGGRYEGMGTAFTAVASDIGFLESNPAGSSRLLFNQLALMHNDWIADSNIEAAAYTFRKGKIGFGFGGKFLYVPFTAYNEWGDRNASAYYSETTAYANISYNFFKTYDYSGLSAGINLKSSYRSIPTAIASGQSGIAFMADLGLLTDFNFLKPYSSRETNFSVGASVKNIGISSDGENLPSLASFGLAYSFFRPLLLSFDYNIPFSLSLPAERWEKPYLAAGADLSVSENFSMQTGFTHRGSNPRFSLGGAVDINSLIIVANYTLDLTTQLTNLDRFSLQASMDLGDGGRAERAEKVDRYFIAGLEAYAKGDLERANEYWKAVLELDPDHRPSKEYLEISSRSLELLHEMRELNTVE